jgi:hypothetical protein
MIKQTSAAAREAAALLKAAGIEPQILFPERGAAVLQYGRSEVFATLSGKLHAMMRKSLDDVSRRRHALG